LSLWNNDDLQIQLSSYLTNIIATAKTHFSVRQHVTDTMVFIRPAISFRQISNIVLRLCNSFAFFGIRFIAEPRNDNYRIWENLI